MDYPVAGHGRHSGRKSCLHCKSVRAIKFRNYKIDLFHVKHLVLHNSNLNCGGADVAWLYRVLVRLCPSFVSSLRDSFLGNHPCWTHLFCSNNSLMLQKQQNSAIAKQLLRRIFSNKSDNTLNTNPSTRKIGQILAPKWYSLLIITVIHCFINNYSCACVALCAIADGEFFVCYKKQFSFLVFCCAVPHDFAFGKPDKGACFFPHLQIFTMATITLPATPIFSQESLCRTEGGLVGPLLL